MLRPWSQQARQRTPRVNPRRGPVAHLGNRGCCVHIRTGNPRGATTEKMLRPWSQQARQLTPRRGTVAHLGNRGCCVHIHRRLIIQRGHEHTRTGNWSESGFGSLITYRCIYLNRANQKTKGVPLPIPTANWPIQDIPKLVFVCARINYPFITTAH